MDATDAAEDSMNAPPAPDSAAADTPDRELVTKIAGVIRTDKKFHEKAFTRMRRDMRVAMYGAEKSWSDANYTANIIGQHVKQKTAALYAKNPKVTARRRETMDFELWDENPQSLMAAQSAVQAAEEALAMEAQANAMAQQEAAAAAETGVYEPTAEAMAFGYGGNGGPPLEEPPAVQEARAIVEDAQRGIERRRLIARYGKTLEILFSYFMREQKPIDGKTGMKQLVRRACTTCVGYVELSFRRETGPSPLTTNRIDDATARLEHLEQLVREIAEGEGDVEAEIAELRHVIEGLMAEPDVVVDEGLVIDFLQSTRVIPDRRCRSLTGFVGARHMTVEYMFTRKEVEEQFGIDIGKEFTPYGPTGSVESNDDREFMFVEDEYGPIVETDKAAPTDLVCVWKHYDKAAGLVYYLADGHPNFLQEPAPPETYVDSFWPLYALTFNSVESETELFPPSDVSLMMDMGREYNRSRQGKREHRQAARPRWAGPNGVFNDEEIKLLQKCEPFDFVGLDIDPDTDIKKLLQPIPVPGVDPNLYDTNEIMQDIALTVGRAPAMLGGLSKATATGDAITAGAMSAIDNAGVDDLDSFLTVVARAAGQILQREMSPEKVAEIAGPGAFWPTLSTPEIADEVFLEVEAGSTGKPNQAVEVNNWKTMLPFLLQMPNINKVWLARETIRRLDDNADLTTAIAEEAESVVAANRSAMAAPPPTPGAKGIPEAQGDAGGANTPVPGRGSGSDPAFGSNQVSHT